MTPRAIRRAAERKARKVILKARKTPGAHVSQDTINQAAGITEEEVRFLREYDQEFAERARAEIAAAAELGITTTAATSSPTPAPVPGRCTGPITAEGKAISSLNRLKHGLTGTFRVLESESPTQFYELCDALRGEHAPATPTETLLVDRMAEHVWLSNRAQRLQDDALLENDEKSFALYLRYQTTNDRGFHRCLREFRTVRKERQQFESQNLSQAVQPVPAQTAESKNLHLQTTPLQHETVTTTSNRKKPAAATPVAATGDGDPFRFNQFVSQNPDSKARSQAV